jgi:outer membrane lipoprotein SlyB
MSKRTITCSLIVLAALTGCSSTAQVVPDKMSHDQAKKVFSADLSKMTPADRAKLASANSVSTAPVINPTKK